MQRILLHIAGLATALLFLSACSSNETADSDSSHKPLIVATTGIIGDAIEKIVGDSADVISLMGPGVDPHTHKPIRQDLVNLNKADFVFHNGLHLEGKMTDVLEKLGKKKPVIAFSDGLSTENFRKAEGFTSYDPHIWFDVALWTKAVRYAGEELIAKDSLRADYYRPRLEAYLQEMEALDNWVKAEIKAIPEDKRLMVTAHDAFGYFGRAYQLEVRGVQGLSTVSEPSVKEVNELSDLLVSRKVKAVFVESSVRPKLVEAVAKNCESKGWKVEIGGELFSDALGEKGTPEGEYIGMVKHNVNTIVSALK